MLSQLRAVRRSKRPDFSKAGGGRGRGDPAGEGEPAKEIAESWGRWSYLLCLSRTGLRVNLYYLLVSIKLKPHLLFSASGPDRLFFFLLKSVFRLASLAPSQGPCKFKVKIRVDSPLSVTASTTPNNGKGAQRTCTS